MITNNKQQIDLFYGNKKENALLRSLNKYFKTKFKKTRPFDEFDFVCEDKKILIELKSRRAYKDQYFDTMIGYNKILKGIDKLKLGYKVYFVFGFKDVVCHYELTDHNNIKENWIRKGGRKDRGKEEIKQYCYIPTHLLINFILKKNNKYNIIYKMEDQRQMTEDQKPKSFSQKLIDYIATNPMKIKDERPNIQQVTWMINNFSIKEYEKRKENKDVMPFGKYKFKKVEDVANFDLRYLKWLVKQDMMANYEDLKTEILKYV